MSIAEQQGFQTRMDLQMRLYHHIARVLDRIKPSQVTRTVRIPNAETFDALRQARAGVGLNEYADLNAFKAEHG